MYKMEAIYILKVKDWNRNCFNEYKIKCIVVSESNTQYKIKILQPTHNRRAGDLLWVRKYNVVFKKQILAIQQIEPEEYKEPWWNKI